MSLKSMGGIYGTARFARDEYGFCWLFAGFVLFAACFVTKTVQKMIRICSFLRGFLHFMK